MEWAGERVRAARRGAPLDADRWQAKWAARLSGVSGSVPHVHTASRSTEAALVSRAHAAVAATRDAAVDLLSARAEDAATDAASRAVHAQTVGRAAVNGLVERRCGAAGGCTRALAEAARLYVLAEAACREAAPSDAGALRGLARTAAGCFVHK